ncbi:ABC transporter permease [Limobrevibacterium gyesilva]|uniref:ABC transporter permease n=1 Tax=Limobrevibacterium gyesilva TaxID=2991712 RepID=A0AA41YQC9_9PROT|nr:ABC transporter permease [Limobrevibacterium gyesilva]MCW3473592.1 ABC transporter permease [Limobrevibacterium gyesilva]
MSDVADSPREIARAADEAPSRRARSRALRRFMRHRLAILGLVVIVLLVFFTAVGPHLIAFDDLHIDVRNRFQPPFAGPHILGSDPLGRDQLARLLMAGRVSLTVGFAAMALSTLVGTLVGAVAGYYGGLVGVALMRFVDAVLCFPTIFLLLALAAFVTPSVVSITLIVAATAWMEVARVVEGQIRALRDRDFAIAAEVLGASDLHIMLRELIPNAMAPIVVAATLNVARAILLESYVSFLGYGIQPPTPSWGNMLENAQEYLGTAPWLAIIPGIAITLAVTSFNFVGDGLRDALDTRLDIA